MRMKNSDLIAGALITSICAICAIGAPWIAPFDPFQQSLYHALASPDHEHLLGRDLLGRDILSRILYGARVSLLVGISVALISSFLGTFIGIVSGYIGGRFDQTTQRIVDVFLAFPGILLAIILMASLGPGLTNVIFALCALGWTSFARLARGQTIALKKIDFIAAAVAQGASPIRIAIREILPNILAPIFVEITFGVASAVIAEAGLSFLGLGAQPPTPSLGAMLAEGRSYILIAPNLTTFPGLAIALIVIGINFLGDGARSLFDPKRSMRAFNI